MSLLRLAYSVSFIFFNNISLSQIKTNISSPTLDICIIINFGGKPIKLWTQFQAEKEMDCKKILHLRAALIEEHSRNSCMRMGFAVEELSNKEEIMQDWKITSEKCKDQ